MPSPSDLVDLARSPGGQKMIRYSIVSAISVVLSLIVLGICNGLIGWSAFWSNVTATGIATVPSFELNRKWAWGKSGKSHLWKEVVPFWALAFVGLAFSTWSAVLAEDLARSHHFKHLERTALIEGAVIGAFGVLWIGKFIIFNKVLFAHHPERLEPALDGRSGIPG